ncbi:hypothetical protein P7C73_g4094, partial [Tremellales sp. Uapishka_1]
MNNASDGWKIKTFVGTLLVVNLFDSVISFVRVIQMGALHAGQEEFISEEQGRVAGVGHVASTYALVSICQAFMIWRVIQFSRAIRTGYGNKLGILYYGVVALLGIPYLASLAGSIGLSIAVAVGGVADRMGGADRIAANYFFVGDLGTVACSSASVPAQGGASFDLFITVAIIQNVASVVLDFALTTFMTIEIRQARSGFASSNEILDTIQSIFMRNNLLASSIQLSQLIVLLVTASTWTDFLAIWLGKLYTLTVLAIICAPRATRNRGHLRETRQNAAEFASEKLKLDATCQACGATPVAMPVSILRQSRPVEGMWSLEDALSSCVEGEAEEKVEASAC